MNENQTNNDQLRSWWLEAVEGDTIAFGCLHENLFEGLYNYALKILDDEDLADDAVQELFVKMWTKRASLTGIEKVREYFFSSLRRQLLNQLRNLKLRQLKIKAFSVPDIEFSPEEIVVHNEESTSLKEKILQVLNELPGRQKEVIYLHYFQGIEYAQIARMMGINYQSVLNLAQKAIQKFRSVHFIFLLLLLFYFF